MKIYGKLKFIIFALVVQILLLMTASAQNIKFIKGAEKPLVDYKSDEKTQCVVFDKYVVKTYLKDNLKDGGAERTGYEFDVFRRDVKYPLKKNCETSADVLLNIKNEEGNEFGGVSGELLFVRRNVFPDNADLDVYDLKKGKIVFTTEFSEWDNYGMNISGGGFLNYRQWSKKDGLLKNCPRAAKWKREGFGISWLQTKKLNLQTMKETSVGNLTCINIQ